VVGRTQRENEALAGLAAPGDLRLTVADHPGPLVLVIGQAGERALQEAAGLAAAYSDAPLGAAVRVSVAGPGPTRTLRLEAPPKDRFQDLLI
jgi:predicted ribosome quality control (RQC) complex YloA/Tae2 family protein